MLKEQLKKSLPYQMTVLSHCSWHKGSLSQSSVQSGPIVTGSRLRVVKVLRMEVFLLRWYLQRAQQD